MTCYGDATDLSIWQPYVEHFNDHSLMQTWLQNYDNGGWQSIEAGWEVDASRHFFNSAPFFFIYYTTNGYTQDGDFLGGFDQDQAGWVQIDQNIFPGAQIATVSAIGGTQFFLPIQFTLFEGNWWLSVLDTWIGFYIGSMFAIVTDPPIVGAGGPTSQINNGGLTAGPPATGQPMVSTINQQWHVVYRDAIGIIWDAWFDAASRRWKLQNLNYDPLIPYNANLTTGTFAEGDPMATAFNQQWHVVYRDFTGMIQDCWWDGPSGTWNLQMLNGGPGGMTNGPAAVGNPMASVFAGQWHVVYRDTNGIIWDSWYDGTWNLQQINAGSLTSGPLTQIDPRAYDLSQQWHVLYSDTSGNLWDSWYDGVLGTWNLQHLNGGGLTTGSVCVGAPTAINPANQWHVIYRDDNGNLVDVFYDGPSATWGLQVLNAGVVTRGPIAASDPSAVVYFNNYHVVYVDAGGIVWDIWFDASATTWNAVQVNMGGLTNAPAAVGNATAAVFDERLYIVFTDNANTVWAVNGPGMSLADHANWVSFGGEVYTGNSDPTQTKTIMGSGLYGEAGPDLACVQANVLVQTSPSLAQEVGGPPPTAPSMQFFQGQPAADNALLYDIVQTMGSGVPGFFFAGGPGNDCLAVAMAVAAGGGGYWVASSEGVLYPFGAAISFGSLPGLSPPIQSAVSGLTPPRALNQPVVGMAMTASGNGYWLVAADGGVFSFGDAAFYGSIPGIRPPLVLNKPVVGMAMTASGNGYWLVAADGGVFSFGDAAFYGSIPGIRPPLVLNKPVVGMAMTASGNGYWLVAADGGVFSFGDAAFFGSIPGITPAVTFMKGVVGMAMTSSGNGYWLVTANGWIFPFGDALDFGSVNQA
ncbi:MAG: neprosin family prolyl endopeptidase [Acidiferrobacterales bacterium]